MSPDAAPGQPIGAPTRPFALIGPGRAGRAVADALAEAGGQIVAVAGRGPGAPSVRRAASALSTRPATVEAAARAAELVIVATPDAAIPEVAARIGPALRPGALVIHLSGALGVDALGAARRGRPDVRTGALHPLVSIPSADLGRARFPGTWCAVDGDDEVEEVAAALGMRIVHVDDELRVRYHAAAAVAANHVVALLGHLERVAAEAELPLDAFLPLARASIDNVSALGPAAALTGPVARGDHGTVAAHLGAIPEEERPAYRALAREALRLRDDDDPALAALLAEPWPAPLVDDADEVRA